MDEAIAVLKQQGAVIVDPADIPSVVDKDPKEQLRCVGRLLRHGRREGQGRELLDRSQVRHEARLQQVAEIARPAAPVKTLTELREWNTRARESGRDQVRAVAARHLRRDGPRARPRALRADRAKDIRWPRRTASTR
jgi:amidase